MGRRARRLPFVLAALLLASAPGRAAAPEGAPTLGPVANFGLLDQDGRFHELHRQAHRKAVVLFVQGNGCPIVRKNVPILKKIRDAWEPRGVVFWMINASPQDDREEIAEEANAWGMDLPILKDPERMVARSLDIDRTAEALLIDPATWRIVYRGPIDDRLHYETERPVREHWLVDALEAHAAGRDVEVPVRTPRGCLILHDREHSGADVPDWSEDVAPILMARCRSCHRDGGPAPWQMTDWGTVRGWAPMMREVLRTGRMPPWRIDPRYGRFRNDLGLPAAERATLVRWIEAGAPRGDGPDPLAEHPAPPEPEWPLGPPDLVLTAPEQTIPATGVLPYRYVRVKLPAEHDLWLRAVDVRPSNAAVMHHTLAAVRVRGQKGWRHDESFFVRGVFGVYAPGQRPRPFPEGTAFRIPAGSVAVLQFHYTTTGRAESDRPRLGLYFADGPPRRELRMGAVYDLDLDIPPHVEDHAEIAEETIDHDILVHSLIPHMHYRGRRFRHDLRLPDGRVETLISVPRYDFNWQHEYVLETPKRVPAGSHMTVTGVFDNSEYNPANPDPDARVHFGIQSSDEMLVGYYLYSLERDTRTARVR
jgi:hypothetical protein